MKIDYTSDIHLAFADAFLTPNEGSKVLILAGDIAEAKATKENYDPNGIMFEFENADRRPDRFIRFFREECSKYDHVFYVMGNHEHYGFHFHKTVEHMRNILPKNVHILDKDFFILDDVVFMGATLWTNFNNCDPFLMHVSKYSMNDYEYITMFDELDNVYHKLTPKKVYEEHFNTMQAFQFIAENHRDKKIVTISHHAPTSLSIHPGFNDDLLNPCYYSDLSEFILDHENIKFWIHGHIHHKSDYMVGECNVLCNPRGYKGYEKVANSFELKSFEV